MFRIRNRKTFNNTSLVVEKINYTNKTVNAFIVKFYNKTFLFGANNIVKDSDKNKYVFSGYGTTFDALGSWKFGNDFTRNVIIFDAHNCSSSHNDNHKNYFLSVS